MFDRRLESTDTPCDASWIKTSAAHSLLPCERQPPVGGLLEQSSCGWHDQQEGWGEEQNKYTYCSCLMFKPVLELTIIISSLISQQTFSVSERSEQQVRFLCAGGSGVWASCRLDPVLRLFDWSTGRPLQEVDFTALVTKTLGATAVLFFSSPIYLDYKNNTFTSGHVQC